jgi:hypothetical protein
VNSPYIWYFYFRVYIINQFADFVNTKMEINGEILEKLAFLEMLCRSGAKRVEARCALLHLCACRCNISPESVNTYINKYISGGQYAQGCAKENVRGQAGAGITV